MPNILVSGLVNLETTCQVERFPVEYHPVRFSFFGIRSRASGVGYNLAGALTTLGDTVTLLSLVGSDPAGRAAFDALAAAGIATDYVLATVRETAQSVILYDPTGRRAIYTDIKDLQEQVYPPDRFAAALAGCDLAVLGTINYSRPFLARAQATGVPIATDVHAVADLDDPYNADFMRAATILFMSHELLPDPPAVWARRVQERYDPAILVIGLGAEGALLAVRGADAPIHVPAAHTRPVVSTVGAGDALFAAFLHSYRRGGDPYESLRRAVVFASWKIGVAGAGEGYLTGRALDTLYAAQLTGR